MASVLLEGMDKFPDPDESVINQFTPKQDVGTFSENPDYEQDNQPEYIPPEEPERAVFDNDGFDPEIHSTDAMGNPVKNKDGSFRKKRGRKRGSTVNPEATYESGNLAKTSVELLVNTCVVTFGEAWLPIKDKDHGIDERVNLEGAFDRFYAEKGLDDLPAGFALVLACSAYALPRLQDQQTKSKLSKLGSWLKQKGGRLRFWRRSV